MAGRTTSIGKYVALLRGINVGGRNKIPMGELVKMFERAGCAEIATYIQSGNVVFTAIQSCAAGIPGEISQAIRRKLGLTVPVTLRSKGEMARVIAGNPFLKTGAEPESLAVAFLAEAPIRQRVAALDVDRSPGDEFVVIGREIYLRLGNGFADTKLTNAWFDSQLQTMSTARNWRTVLKLAEMVR